MGGRDVLVLVLAMTAWCAVAFSGLAAPSYAQTPLKIGIIGSGRIGGTMGEHWVKAGHEVLFSSRHPDELKPLAERLVPKHVSARHARRQPSATSYFWRCHTPQSPTLAATSRTS